jgi:hypothetical protein
MRGPNTSSSAPAASAETAINFGTSGTNSKTINIGVDTATKVEVKALNIKLDAGSTGMTLSSVGALAMDTVGTTAINLGTEAAAKTITIGNDASTKVDINALAIELDAGSTGMTLSSVGALAMDTVGTAAINLGTEAAAKTITIGNDASTKVDINALAIELDAGSGGVLLSGLPADTDPSVLDKVFTVLASDIATSLYAGRVLAISDG